MGDYLSPLERDFWKKYTTKDIIVYNELELKPWEHSCPPAVNLRNILTESLDKFKPRIKFEAANNNYKPGNAKKLIEEARKIYNDKSNNDRHLQSLRLTYEALYSILSEEPLVKSEHLKDKETQEKLELLANALVLWDKNSAWLGVSDKEPLSTLAITAYRMWIYRHGIAIKNRKEVKIVSTLAYALIRLGRWAGAMECLQWALQQKLDETSRRDLVGAMAVLLSHLEEHDQASTYYKEYNKLNKGLAAPLDAKYQSKGSEAILMLNTGRTREAEIQVLEALNELEHSRHTGFQLQLFSKLADYYFGNNRIDDAEGIVTRALKLVDNHPKSFENYRKRFNMLQEYLKIKQGHGRSIIHTDVPLYELVATAKEALVDNRRISAIVLLVALIETITLTMWLAREQDILGNWPTQFKQNFPPEGEWKEYGKNLYTVPTLGAKNKKLRDLSAYNSDDADRNTAIFDWIDELRNTRNTIFHGHPLSEKVRYASHRVENLYKWYTNMIYLLEQANEDIKNYYRRSIL